MARRQARRSGSTGGHGFLSFMAGLICGLVLATVAAISGYLPTGSAPPTAQPSGHDEPPIAEPREPGRSRQFEFFTVLPEIEVVVPQREIEQRAREPVEATTPTAATAYVLQIGSFRSASDADGLRAQVTLLGLSSHIQTVTVNDATWHRVRVGPFDNARDADSARRRLQENGFEPMVLSGG